MFGRVSGLELPQAEVSESNVVPFRFYI